MSKGKGPERGRCDTLPPPDPNWQQNLSEREDQWSLPCPPPKWRQEPPQPTSDADDNTPWLRIKPIMIRPPVPFEGKYDDIKRFVGDCCMYFKVYAPFFQLHSQRVAFAASYFESTAKDWWAEFVRLLSRQFHDPATEDVHERKMFDLRMGKGPAISYFNELEIEAKKAGQ
ncbi:uncharacterized protein ARMOST_08558 [Armillaria ostoyae]|uniref:Retrotransposon gag domain-containing protein n=1 Tax=Armillaria ostoyae TaxID=47428 RepID=A0A284R916_ARMOS|nr:uncharacterized protein ARMOST_08558 [Armillaria ostoyae]